MVGVSVSDWLN